VPINDASDVSGVRVRSAEGESLGFVRSVHVPARSTEPLFVQVPTRRDDGAEHIVPVLDATMEDGELRLPYTSELVRSGPVVDPDAVLSVGEVAWLITHYGAGSVDFGDQPMDTRVTEMGDVSASDEPEVRRLPPIVVTRTGLREEGTTTIKFAGRPDEPQ
jgi:hypothetical protein